MGFHICAYCNAKDGLRYRFSNCSSGDVTLVFANDRIWQMPDMILHYVGDHNWLPPEDFVNDVMNEELASGLRQQTRSIRRGSSSEPRRIAYLTEELETGDVPDGFVERLQDLMVLADAGRLQTKGVNFMKAQLRSFVG